ncbi:hypothetical protein TIFTF001_053996 [Ficus carica]|uniref:Uncharacterized protein n=1 Tax=Ficus carica TaxID=3494 RepID=A0AA88EAQ5_FICCA|nr:hypothetical protein TIFTF001_053996 [Ficus carica]
MQVESKECSRSAENPRPVVAAERNTEVGGHEAEGWM